MRNYIVALLGLCLIIAVCITGLGTVRPGSLGDKYFPSLGNQGYDALHYDLDITPDFDAETLNATVEIEMQAAKDLTEFNLDFWGYTITNVTIEAQRVGYERDKGELIIIPNAPIATGDTFEVTVAYNGKPREGIPEDVFYLGPEFQASAGWVLCDE